ncbi:MAG: hypothetical protein J7M20_00225 [Deltaproteobacteria bacterium]|nr:hypothetical protein [Deltaproteobacteria bacterium]
MVEKQRLFDSEQMVAAFGGQVGVVMGQDMYDRARKALREGRKTGRYFAPGCCHHPDYITQVPVLFEDGSYDVMRSMNIKKQSDIPEEKRLMIQDIIQKNELAD